VQSSGGGGGAGAGVAFEGGADDLLRPSGVLRTEDGLDGVALSGTDGDDRGVSSGMVMGNLSLGDGADAFVTRTPDAVFVAGRSLDLGNPGSTFRNEGVLSLGMAGSNGTVQTTAMAGLFT
jgi:hypothetical protein